MHLVKYNEIQIIKYKYETLTCCGTGGQSLWSLLEQRNTSPTLLSRFCQT